VLTFVIALAIMFAVVGASVQWAVRAERRHNPGKESDARHH
jgi:hypothetical protein